MRCWWIGLALLWAVGCDDGAPVAPLDAALADAGDADVDAAAGPALGEACPDGRCALGADCQAGRCTRACAGDGDCPETGLRCAGVRGGLGICAPECGAEADCLPGERCAPLAPGLGACVAPGPAAAGEACAEDADCDSQVCSAGVCLARCVDGCAAGDACLPLHTLAVCVTAGAGGDEALCGVGADCASGVCRGGRCTVACPEGVCPHDRVCRPYQTLSLCERRCAASAECGERAACALVAGLTQCVTRGPGAAGAPCGGASDCASAVCTDDGLCAAPCGVDGSCPGGFACRTDLTGSTCRPAGVGGLGEACADDLGCASGLCAAGRCSVGCAAGTCPAGLRCVRFLAGAYCFAPCRDGADCPASAYCEPGFSEGPACFWRGPTADDGACGRHADCASGRCSEGRCLPECPTGRCPGDRVCAAFDAGAWCTPVPAVLGAACTAAADCADGLGCVAGLCLPGCAGGCPPGTACATGPGGAACHPRCERDDGCRPARPARGSTPPHRCACPRAPWPPAVPARAPWTAAAACAWRAAVRRAAPRAPAWARPPAPCSPRVRGACRAGRARRAPSVRRPRRVRARRAWGGAARPPATSPGPAPRAPCAGPPGWARCA
ncbi:MAG: hypothetical protein H6702_18405 [Myxococcales bacterium]|nr:hypothetical protein [Myxococcales bacterium]